MTDEERIRWIAGVIRSWSPLGTDVEIMYVFGYLDEIPRDQFPEAWDEVRRSFSANQDLDDSWLKEGIRDIELAKKGKWWWDPDNWKF
jgi:hypothetical protein